MRYALLGALLIVGGIARIVASRHAPGFVPTPGGSLPCPPGIVSCGNVRASGWSHTAYDLVRVGGWALLVFGAVIVAFALVRALSKSRSSVPHD